MSFYSFDARRINGSEMRMETLKGKVVLIVNTASKCGLTPQFAELEELHQKYGKEGLLVLGFPCGQFAGQEFENSDEIHAFCQRNYGVTFDMFEKVDVNGRNAHPLFVFLRKRTGGIFSNAVKWNFTKFLISRDGNTIRRFAPTMKPSMIAGAIEKLLATPTERPQ
jgi:glutathione peroxidase